VRQTILMPSEYLQYWRVLWLTCCSRHVYQILAKDWWATVQEMLLRGAGEVGFLGRASCSREQVCCECTGVGWYGLPWACCTVYGARSVTMASCLLGLIQ
jgi:hypothetical protein